MIAAAFALKAFELPIDGEPSAVEPTRDGADRLPLRFGLVDEFDLPSNLQYFVDLVSN